MTHDFEDVSENMQVFDVELIEREAQAGLYLKRLLSSPVAGGGPVPRGMDRALSPVAPVKEEEEAVGRRGGGVPEEGRPAAAGPAEEAANAAPAPPAATQHDLMAPSDAPCRDGVMDQAYQMTAKIAGNREDCNAQGAIATGNKLVTAA